MNDQRREEDLKSLKSYSQYIPEHEREKFEAELNLMHMRLTKEMFKANSLIVGGHTFHVLDPLDLPKSRQLAFHLLQHELSWGIGKQDLRDFVKLMYKELNFPSEGYTDPSSLSALQRTQIERVRQFLNDLDFLIAKDYQWKPYLRAASIIILLDDEDPHIVDKEANAKKMKICSENQDVEFFFIRTIRNLLISTRNTSITSEMLSWSPSAQVKLIESKIYQGMGSTIY